METLQKLFLVGFLLVSIIPLTQLMTTINNSIVDIFATQVDWSDGGRVANNSGTIAGLVVELFYFIANLYLNFVYIMRSIMIAILVATGPFFVVTMAFTVKGKGLFDNWSKELIANVFLQAFHAFSFAFILNVQGASRGIEELVIACSLVPLTEFFRTMIFGQSGNFAITQGKMLAKQGATLATKTGEAFSTSSNHKSSNKHNKESNFKDDKTKQNSNKLQNSTKTKLGKAMGIAGKVSQKTFDGALATSKMASGLALGGDVSDGATDFRSMIESGKQDFMGRIEGFSSKNYNKNGVLGYKETGTGKQPIRSKNYLQGRGLDYVSHKGGGTLLIKDRNRLNKDDKENLQALEDSWNNPNTDRNLFLKKNGIDNILTNKSGITSIGYNKQGLKKLNINKVKEGDHFGEKALYEDRINNKLNPVYTFKPIQTLKPQIKEEDNNTREKAN